jgi:hypothetical protein
MRAMPGDLAEDVIDRAVAESRLQTAATLRDALRTATVPILAKLAVDLVPELFRNDYDGEPFRRGDRWADAIAKPRMTVLPPFLVRVHHGAFGVDDVQGLLAAMMAVHAPQAALVVIGPLVAPGVRNTLGAAVPWLVDTDGLIHLMIGANVGVASRVYEAKYVNADYFR